MSDTLMPQSDHYQRKAISAIKPWLIANNTAKRGGRVNFNKSSSYHAAQAIYNVKMPGEWRKIQNLRSNLDHVETSQRLLECRFDIGRAALKACDLSRLAYIHLAVMANMPVEVAEKKSWDGLDSFTRKVLGHTGLFPHTELLDLPLDEAINSYLHGNVYKRPADTCAGMVGLAAVVLSQQTAEDNAKSKLVWIEPGTPDSLYQQWSNI